MGRKDFRTQVLRVATAICVLVAVACYRGGLKEAAGTYDPTTADSLRSLAERRNRTAATQVVDFSENERRRFTRVEQMIQAHFSGVQVTPTGSGFSIRIRGASSINLSTEPLIVVDGIEEPPGTLANINPLDVVRIEIIKDGTAAFYGSRGANGVIIVTLRRARS